MDAVIEKKKKETNVKRKIKIKNKDRRELVLFIENAKHLNDDQINDLLSNFVIKE